VFRCSIDAITGEIPMPTLELLDRQEEHWALLRQSQGGAGRSLAIFVHGFLGDHLTTWGRLPEMLREHAPNEPLLVDWDFLFLGYVTRQIVSYLDIARLIATQWEKAAAGKLPFSGAYNRFALLGHSLGTLGIRQLLCAGVMQPQQMLELLHSITLFGTPLNGSPLAWYGAKLVGGAIAEALKPGNPQLRMLRSWNESVHPLLPWKGVRVVLGTDDQVVGNKYVDLVDFAGDARPAVLLTFDHKNLVKPTDWASSTIRDEIVGALQ
jgi:pimeloyl-ACP methyl ester carboxylesterase